MIRLECAASKEFFQKNRPEPKKLEKAMEIEGAVNLQELFGSAKKNARHTNRPKTKLINEFFG
jgi:hypothetical protein